VNSECRRSSSSALTTRLRAYDILPQAREGASAISEYKPARRCAPGGSGSPNRRVTLPLER